MVGDDGKNRRDHRSSNLPGCTSSGWHWWRFTSALWRSLDRRESILHQTWLAGVDFAILAASPGAFLSVYGMLRRSFLPSPTTGRKWEYPSRPGVGVSPTGNPARRRFSPPN